MIELAGYRIVNVLYQGKKSTVYRAIRERDSLPVVLKFHNSEYPTHRELAKYQREKEIAERFNNEGIIKIYGMEKFGNGNILVMEDFQAMSLADVLEKGRPSREKLLELFIRVVDSLEQVHADNIIHKDIKPANIVVNRESGTVKLIDFGISSLLSRESSFVKSPGIMEGTLNYMSPEQTGRMNRAVDYRTDLYSLGATMYEAFTGRLPFIAEDPVELVHSHIARTPEAPAALDSGLDIPPVLSRIIMKLLSKTPEDRYQSTYGLRADLEECLRRVRRDVAEDFELGRHDLSERFQIPQKLYGRETEIQELLNAFERAAAGNVVFLMVSGRSGIGKSVLVNEVQKPIVARRGFFISGKYDQFQRDIPYSALIQAFQALIQQLLAESPDVIAMWKSRLSAILGVNGQVIVDVIPEVEGIIGPQQEVAQLSPAEAQNRFNIVFQNFIRAFARHEHPLSVFLDDLQWADSASLKLLHALVTDPESEFLLMLGSYRDNEVDEAHPLRAAMRELTEQGTTIENISLEPLTGEDVAALVSETLHRPADEIAEVAELVMRNTLGNPFFVNELLKNLSQQDLIFFNRNEGKWDWDSQGIRSAHIMDNVVDLMVAQIQKLPASTQEQLKLAACLGNRFDLRTFSLAYGKSSAQTAAELEEALLSGLIVPNDDSYKYAKAVTGESDSGIEPDKVSYDFLHDRVQQAAYSLLTEGEKKELHLSIGRKLRDRFSPEDREENLLDIVSHLNSGREGITDAAEKLQLAELNLQAARKTKASAAFAGARRLSETAMELMPPDAWESHYDLTVEMHIERATLEYTVTNFEAMEKYLDAVFENSRVDLEQVRVLEMRSLFYFGVGKIVEAVDSGLAALKMLGLEITEQPDAVDLGGREVEDLINLPDTEDPRILAMMRVLRNISLPALFSGSPLVGSIIIKQVVLTLEHGNAPSSGFGYGFYSMLLGGIFHDYETGHRFGRLAVDLQAKFQDKAVRVTTNFLYLTWGSSWKNHIRDIYRPAVEVYDLALEVGDIWTAAAAIQYITNVQVSSGGVENLDSILKRIEQYENALMKTGAALRVQFYTWKQLALNLAGRCDDPLILKGDTFNEEEVLPQLIEMRDVMSIYFVYYSKMILEYQCGTLEKALEFSDLAEQHKAPLTGALYLPVHCLFDSMIRIGLIDRGDLDTNTVQAYRDRINENQTFLGRLASSCPENYGHMQMLVDAELARLDGDIERAEKLYDDSVDSARSHDYFMVEGIANERASAHYSARGRARFASLYMREAHYAYKKFGAVPRLKILERNHPEYLRSISAYNESGSSSDSITVSSSLYSSLTSSSLSSTSSTDALDLRTVIKVSQTVADEIVLEKLLEKLIRIVMESAGAQRAVVILNRNQRFFVEAESAVYHDDTRVLQGIPVDEYGELPSAILNYVVRMRDSLVLNDALNRGQFINDSYVARVQPRSVLCMPILHQNHLTGLLYLENKLTTDAFTPDRLELLKLLSVQIAISLEHAVLYANLEQKVQERTRELQEAQSRLLELEKEATERQMAGGFAHEMRNALAGSKLVVEQALGLDRPGPPMSVNLRNGRRLKDLYEYLKPIVAEGELSEVLAILREVFGNEEHLDSVLGIVYKATSRGLKITQQIMDYSRLGQEQSGREMLDIAELIRGVISAHEHPFRQAGINVETTLSENQLVSGYEAHYYSLVENILVNARDAVLEKEGERWIRVKSELAEGLCRISIADNGTGIESENLERVYDAFFSTKPDTGTGLGMSTVKKIVNLYGGSINLDSEPGRGTTVRVVLPA